MLNFSNNSIAEPPSGDAAAGSWSMVSAALATVYLQLERWPRQQKAKPNQKNSWRSRLLQLQASTTQGLNNSSLDALQIIFFAVLPHTSNILKRNCFLHILSHHICIQQRLSWRHFILSVTSLHQADPHFLRYLHNQRREQIGSGLQHCSHV